MSFRLRAAAGGGTLKGDDTLRGGAEVAVGVSLSATWKLRGVAARSLQALWEVEPEPLTAIGRSISAVWNVLFHEHAYYVTRSFDSEMVALSREKPANLKVRSRFRR